MTEEEKTNAVAGIVENWGFTIPRRDTQEVVLRYQLNYVSVIAAKGDENFISVNLDNFYEIENDAEKTAAGVVCNALNYRLLQTKVYINEDGVPRCSFEFYFQTPEDIEFYLRKGLDSVVMAKRDFIRQMTRWLEANTEADE